MADLRKQNAELRAQKHSELTPVPFNSLKLVAMLSAVIKKTVGEIALHEWEAVIEAHPALAPLRPFHQFNPFTGETNWISGEGAAQYIGPEGDGGMALICGEINAANVPLAVCEEVAAMLGGEVHDFAEWENK